MVEAKTKNPSVIEQVLTEYKNVPVSCSKCGDKVRTDENNQRYCPNLIADCPLLK